MLQMFVEIGWEKRFFMYLVEVLSFFVLREVLKSVVVEFQEKQFGIRNFDENGNEIVLG